MSEWRCPHCRDKVILGRWEVFAYVYLAVILGFLAGVAAVVLS